MDTFDKLRILADAAKYDVACTSSGVDKSGAGGALGNAKACGICHSFAADGRCISLLKVLLSNACSYDCVYCKNRRSNDVERATFAPRELADLTIAFYRRNYIEGLFISSGILGTPDATCERMIETLRILREEYGFRGYIHAKAIPGADDALIERLGLLCDRMSVNIELPSNESLTRLAPDKSKAAILRPMGLIRDRIGENARDLIVYKNASAFAPAGQSTQLIVGATGESDRRILRLSQAMYQKYKLKRVFYSAYIPVNESPLLPSADTRPPLLREHRIYQADWLLRFYGFTADELLDEQHENFNQLIDPKCNWAINHPEIFPVDVNTAPRELLLRVPGIGVNSAMRILRARRSGALDFAALRKLGVVLKRAQYFILCRGRLAEGVRITPDIVLRSLVSDSCRERLAVGCEIEQLSLFTPLITREDTIKCLTGQM
ncbi:MAG: putative DNA modification/repair radical SAM protein [Oscillospiraceae bacterium]|nr:putative DNA modification/repair radical SAM protein [Oscillospiraceae bacterium]